MPRLTADDIRQIIDDYDNNHNPDHVFMAVPVSTGIPEAGHCAEYRDLVEREVNSHVLSPDGYTCIHCGTDMSEIGLIDQDQTCTVDHSDLTLNYRTTTGNTTVPDALTDRHFNDTLRPGDRTGRHHKHSSDSEPMHVITSTGGRHRL